MRKTGIMTTVAVAAAVALTGCAGAEDTGAPAAAPVDTPTSSAPAPETAQAAGTDASPSPSRTIASPDKLADELSAVYWSSDSTTDDSPLDAARRAADWLTPSARALIANDLPGGAGAAWIELAKHDGRYEVSVSDATEAMPDLPSDTETEASRGRIIELQPVGSKGWTSSPIILVAQLDLVRAAPDAPWLVDKITVDEPLTDPNAAGDAH
jgi:hypothetical protein